MANDETSEQKSEGAQQLVQVPAGARDLLAKARRAYSEGEALQARTLLQQVEKDFANLPSAVGTVQEALLARTQLDEELAKKAKALVAEGHLARRQTKVAEARGHFDMVASHYADVPPAAEIVEEAKAFRALIDQSTKSEAGGLTVLAAGLGVIAFYGLVGAGIGAIFFDRVREFWKEHAVTIVIAVVVLAVVALLLLGGEKALRKLPAGTRHTVVAFSSLVLIAAVMLGLMWVGAEHMVLAAQVILILVTALIPVAVYYLFLATRRPSILNEFVGNLSRLGLLARRTLHRTSSGAPIAESEEERRTRVESYFQRFEARYGALRFAAGSDSREAFVTRLIDAVEAGQSSARIPLTSVNFGDIFRGNLVIPIGLVTVLVTLGWLLVLQPRIPSAVEHAASKIEQVRSAATDELTTTAQSAPASQLSRVLKADLSPVATALNFAFLGTYFFGLQMLFRRFVRRDLGPNAYLAFSTRIIIAVIGVWILVIAYPMSQTEEPNDGTAAKGSAVPALLDRTVIRTSSQGSTTVLEASGLAPSQAVPPLLLILAFAIGVFPRLLWQFLSSVVGKATKWALPNIEAKQPLSELDGLTVWHESRLEEEDVENVPNMASVDIVEIMLHTQIPAERLITWIDQAILYSALGPVHAKPEEGSIRGKLRSLGLRTASQLFAVWTTTEGRGALSESLKPHSDHMIAALVTGIEKEANFDLVRAWRRV